MKIAYHILISLIALLVASVFGIAIKIAMQLFDYDNFVAMVKHISRWDDGYRDSLISTDGYFSLPILEGFSKQFAIIIICGITLCLIIAALILNHKIAKNYDQKMFLSKVGLGFVLIFVIVCLALSAANFITITGFDGNPVDNTPETEVDFIGVWSFFFVGAKNIVDTSHPFAVIVILLITFAAVDLLIAIGLVVRSILSIWADTNGKKVESDNGSKPKKYKNIPEMKL